MSFEATRVYRGPPMLDLVSPSTISNFFYLLFLFRVLAKENDVSKKNFIFSLKTWKNMWKKMGTVLGSFKYH